MSYFKKIIWSEGMFLTPHHFQQWDRYNEANIYDRFRISTPYGWGVSEMSIDNDGLANGSFTLLNFSGVIQDGLIIRIPEQDLGAVVHAAGPDLPPETRHVMDLFPPSMEHLDVYLGIPVYNPSVSNCRMDDTARSRPTRYTIEYTKVPDENTGENVREIAIARKNLKIFFSGDETGDNITIKIAEKFS
jgi:type VI secretion system protein ImpJ